MTLKEAWYQLLDFCRGRKLDYLIFRSPQGNRVLQDLAKFCRASETCYHPEEFMRGVLTGRREVWLRIQQQLNLTAEDLALLASGRAVSPLEEDNA